MPKFSQKRSAFKKEGKNKNLLKSGRNLTMEQDIAYFHTFIGIEPLRELPIPDMEEKYAKFDIGDKNLCFIEVMVWDDFNNHTAPLKALIDTGATTSVVNPSCLECLDNVKFKQLYTVQSLDMKNYTRELYSAKITISAFGDMPRLEFDFLKFVPLSNIDMVIGTQLLQQFQYGFNVPEKGKFYLRFKPT